MNAETPAPPKLSGYPIDGRYNQYGGLFVPEILVPALHALHAAHREARADAKFHRTLRALQAQFAGRPTPLYEARRLSAHFGGAPVLLKREDLLHGGAHLLNGALGQALLAQRMGKTRLIAETGSGQHGVAVAMTGAVLGLPVEVYMGQSDMVRQPLNVRRMTLMGAKVHPVDGPLCEALSEALRDWTASVRTTHLVLGSAVGPHPYPALVRDFQSVIGDEIKGQILRDKGKLPEAIVACVGGGGNAIGAFYPFVEDRGVRLLGAEAGGSGERHAAALTRGTVGVLHGAKSYVVQDGSGGPRPTGSIAAGLGYPGVGPEHALYKDAQRAEYTAVGDAQALEAFRWLAELEGIIPALEAAHAVYAGVSLARTLKSDRYVVIVVSGRGDKDLELVEQLGQRAGGGLA